MFKTERRRHHNQRAAYRLLDAFMMHHPGVKERLDQRYAQVYVEQKAPTYTWYPQQILLTVQRKDGSTLRMFLPPASLEHEVVNAWQEDRLGGIEILRVKPQARRVSIPATSALLGLARQYDVPVPRDLDNVSYRNLKAFFRQLQTTIYSQVGADLYFPIEADTATQPTAAGLQHADYQRFVMLSLLTQARGGELTLDRYLALYPLHVAAKKQAARTRTAVINDVQEMQRADLLLRNPALMRDEAAFMRLSKVPVSMLRDLYAVY